MARALILASALGLAACLPGCRDKTPPPAPSASAAPTPAPAADREATLRRLLTAEMRRVTSDVKDEDVTSRDPLVRRQAARALARIADAAALARLDPMLADEDADVVAWAAYGLGWGCKGRESVTVRALVARAGSLVAEPARTDPEPLLEPNAALADALARCGNAEAEATLRAWLGVPSRADAAALALGRLASRRKRLEDASVVALLDAASRPEKPLRSALFAFTRLEGLSAAVQSRLLEVAGEALSDPAGPTRAFAVRALGRAGAGAVDKLAMIVSEPRFSPSERADAARELAKIDPDGQAGLRRALVALEPKPGEVAKLMGADYGPVITTLEALSTPVGDARPVLERIAALEVPKETALARRIVSLRCRSAVLLAGSSTGEPQLTGCDPDPEGITGQLALLEVLGKEKLGGVRGKRWKSFAESKNGLIRQQAIGMMAAHPEIVGPQAILARALRAPDAGTVAAAAQVIAAYPARAAERPPEEPPPPTPDAGLMPSATPAEIKPHPAVVDALTTAFTVQRTPDSTEVWSSLMGAAGALQLLSFKPKLDVFCKSDNPTLREHAERALQVLGEKRRTCSKGAPGKPPKELDSIPSQPVKLVFEFDSAEVELTLEPSLAPVAAARFTTLGKAGFFQGVSAHRVVPGFVVQLGDPGGDGYGGSGAEPLRCETSPLPFGPRTVGVALSGRDTGSSQLFVTLGAFPHLDGDYALIGHAGPGWERIARGDVIRKVRVEVPSADKPR